jgi:hypothetical protein
MTYRTLIATATGINESHHLALIEDWMRQQTGGCLDHLSRQAFGYQARRAVDDLAEFNSQYPAEFLHYSAAVQP